MGGAVEGEVADVMVTPRLIFLLGVLIAVVTVLGPAVCSLLDEAQKAGVA